MGQDYVAGFELGYPGMSQVTPGTLGTWDKDVKLSLSWDIPL